MVIVMLKKINLFLRDPKIENLIEIIEHEGILPELKKHIPQRTICITYHIYPIENLFYTDGLANYIEHKIRMDSLPEILIQEDFIKLLNKDYRKHTAIRLDFFRTVNIKNPKVHPKYHETMETLIRKYS